MWFQVLFHSPTGVLFTIFARATGSLSVAEEYLALEGGPSGFKPGFTCPTLLGCPFRRAMSFAYGAITHYGVLSSVLRLDMTLVTPADGQPVRHGSHDPTCTTLLGLHA